MARLFVCQKHHKKINVSSFTHFNNIFKINKNKISDWTRFFKMIQKKNAEVYDVKVQRLRNLNTHECRSRRPKPREYDIKYPSPFCPFKKVSKHLISSLEMRMAALEKGQCFHQASTSRQHAFPHKRGAGRPGT